MLARSERGGGGVQVDAIPHRPVDARFESGAYSGFNVPIPSAINSPEGGIGATVTFFAYFNETGTFTWNCEAPCDPFSMATDGFMTGTMTVVAP